MAKSMISWYAEVENMSAAAAAKIFGGVPKESVLKVFAVMLKDELAGTVTKSTRAVRKPRKKAGAKKVADKKTTRSRAKAANDDAGFTIG